MESISLIDLAAENTAREKDQCQGGKNDWRLAKGNRAAQQG
jgi:hypothetical protein